MIYETPRLVARPLTQADLASLSKTLTDPLTMYAYAHGFSQAEVQAWLDNQLRRYREDGFGLWALERKADGRFVGQCGLTIQQFRGESVVEIGYLLQRDYWHQGLAIEAARGAKAYAFSTLGVPRVWSIIRDTNLASMNVAIRNGMLVRGRDVKRYYGLDMPHLGFAVDRA
ncbi:GNAT family N-acetyltransferase [Lacticaseibacillus kribbianus]|uniref:GNAT family N-acetyltransferase n=1 Tax=Lacticaseibacillus kribbianus TaxID=2926292 RepID=UPI001CD68CAD|nr:GNAT family N-acetyltransferase [Lacticaseibacillus kribbianus]